MNEVQEKKLDEIHAVLVGNDQYKQKGLIQEVHELKAYKEKDERFKAKVAGGLAVGTPVGIAAWHWFMDWLKNK